MNGYFGGGLYSRMGGKIWIRQMVLSAFLMPALVCGTAFFINFIAMYYHASRYVYFVVLMADNNIATLVLQEQATAL